MWVFIPFMFTFVFITPTYLLFDFGVYFFVYLRGSGTVSSLAGELLFDCINLFGFYVRVYVQCVRIVLILTTLGSYQETLIELNNKCFFFGYNDTLVYFFNNHFYTSFILFDFFFKLVAIIIYFLYEIFHTYFVVTIQTIAFFAMVFWLFFYLFTFFTVESFENYFEKRKKFYVYYLCN